MTENDAPYIPLDAAGYKAMREAGTPHLLLDVREPFEYAQAHIPGAVLIPMGQLGNRLDELEGHEHVVVACRTGSRSAMVAMGLHDHGLTNTFYNLEGGIVAWARAGHEVEQVTP
jgi:sulfur-carrier protein adenylyltransferase/sulfurtransferase